MRILITGARSPAALHLARCFHSSGHEVILADSQRFPLARCTRFKQDYHLLPPAVAGLKAYGLAVEIIVKNARIDLIIPTCEEIFHLAAWRDLYHSDIPLFAPAFNLLAMAHNKYQFTQLIAGCGADAAPTTLLTSKQDLMQLAEQATNLVFKPAWSRFAANIFVCPSSAAITQLNPSQVEPWVAQRYLPGEELCCWAVLHNGQVMALSSYRPLYRLNLGASVAFQQVQDEGICNFVAAFGQKTGWTGQVAFDFRRDGHGNLHAIECNPRATSGVNLFSDKTQLAAAFLATAEATADRQQPMTLPLAFLLYGLPDAIRQQGIRGVKKWLADWRQMTDINYWPTDRNSLAMQFLSLTELAIKAIKTGKSLSEVSTHDIEWNGEQL